MKWVGRNHFHFLRSWGFSLREVELEKVPLAALEEQHRASDPLQKTFAALMISYANGDTISDSLETAHRYGVRLHSVSDYAATFRKAADA